ncbi:hypothetical protein [Streptomyces sp. NBC_00239]|uniref:hypothetical protein n=1 Tax=Streptomyces sp. NBC_00239 TaxID=2903640 RepID=UPI002E2DAF42|nr:hypothetical protein [Streptomyces sp. NBC_00239]
MPSRVAAAVHRASSRAVAQESAGWLLATVTAVHADGTLDISTSTGPVAHVRRLSHCAADVGDTVKVDRAPGGSWLVVGVVSTGPRGSVSLARAATWNLSASTYTGIEWDTVLDGVAGMAPSGGSPARIPLDAGSWRVSFQQTWPSGATAARVKLVTPTREYHGAYMASSTGGQGVSGTVPIFLSSAGWVEVQLFSTAAISLPVDYSVVLVERVNG